MLAALMPASASTFSPELLGGQAAALQPLVRAVVAAVLRESVRHPDVDDCTNEALRRAIEGQENLRDGQSLRPWVIGIARHVALDTLRARKKGRLAEAPRSDDSSEDVSAIDRVPDSKPNPFERVAGARRDAMVREAIDTLPDQTRKALVLFHLEGKSYQEIALQMKVPLGTVATWVTRGRKAIAERLERFE
jgi:RNA polymerase sigma factor (sigma-70 family)